MFVYWLALKQKPTEYEEELAYMETFSRQVSEEEAWARSQTEELQEDQAFTAEAFKRFVTLEREKDPQARKAKEETYIPEKAELGGEGEIPLRVWRKRSKMLYPFSYLEEEKEQRKRKILALQRETLLNLQEDLMQQKGREEVKDKKEEKPKENAEMRRGNASQIYSTLLEHTVIFLDPGHGGKDTGALSPEETEIIWPEKRLTLLYAQKLAAYLRDLGATVYLTREEDSTHSLAERMAQVGLKSLELFEVALQKERAYRNEKKEEKEEAYFRSLQDAYTEAKPYLLSYLQEIIRANKDEYSGILGGFGQSYQARLLYDLQQQLPQVMFLSIHMNANVDTNMRGTQAYFLRSGYIFDHFNEVVQEDEKASWFYDESFLTAREEGRLSKLLPDELTEPKAVVSIVKGELSSKEQESEALKQALEEEQEQRIAFVEEESQEEGGRPLRIFPHYLNFPDKERLQLAFSLWNNVRLHSSLPYVEENGALIDYYFAVLRTSGFPSVLYETGFISNPEDFALLKEEKEQDRIVEAWVAGIIEYYAKLETKQS